MLGKVLKWIGIVLGGLLVLAALALLGVYVSAGQRLTRNYTVPVEAVAIPTGAAALERGAHRADVACQGCHGDNLAGGMVFDDPQLAHIEAPNLTLGAGGVGATFSDADFVRAIRHGVTPDGRPLIAMPSAALYYLSDDDLGAIIAYVKTVPPVDHQVPPVSFTPLGRVMLGAGAFGDIVSAEVIHHNDPRPVAPVPGVTAAYGEYLVNVSDCRLCHGRLLAGGKSPNPQAPPAPNLTPGGELAGWSEQDFITALRTGKAPARRLSEFMPWKELGRMNDEELKAIWLYLKSLPAGQTGK
jgi:mono/diheme cytochrome c family protein